jgi:Na+-transporting methylmalonyl-CoA/oxaloacetate decarboxylase gamma subunit
LSIKDALTISLIGITIVFIGLILTSLLIYSFSIIRKIGEKNKISQKQEKSSKIKQIKEKEIPSDILAVISTIVEIETRLLFSLRGTKWTFDEGAPRGWSEEGKMIINPFEGGKIK